MNDFNHSRHGSAATLRRLLEMARTSALAELASGIAHELNQPLGAIATFSQAGDRLLNRPEPLVERAVDVFRQINSEALGAGEGIRRIRRLFDNGVGQRTRCGMGEVIEEMRPVFEMMAGWASVGLDIEVAPLLPQVTIDRLRVQHVLFSMFQNSLEACLHNGSSAQVTVNVRADRYAVETGIADLGAGITAETRDEIFKPFYSTKPHGVGLGLASSRAIIEAHEGTIGFDSHPESGTRFWFRLPIAE